MGSTLSIVGQWATNNLNPIPESNKGISKNYDKLRLYRTINRLSPIDNKYDVIWMPSHSTLNGLTEYSKDTVGFQQDEFSIKIVDGSVDETPSVIIRLEYTGEKHTVVTLSQLSFRVRIYDMNHNGVNNERHENIMVSGMWKELESNKYELIKRYQVHIPIKTSKN